MLPPRSIMPAALLLLLLLLLLAAEERALGQEQPLLPQANASSPDALLANCTSFPADAHWCPSLGDTLCAVEGSLGAAYRTSCPSTCRSCEVRQLLPPVIVRGGEARHRLTSREPRHGTYS